MQGLSQSYRRLSGDHVPLALLRASGASILRPAIVDGIVEVRGTSQVPRTRLKIPSTNFTRINELPLPQTQSTYSFIRGFLRGRLPPPAGSALHPSASNPNARLSSFARVRLRRFDRQNQMSWRASPSRVFAERGLARNLSRIRGPEFRS